MIADLKPYPETKESGLPWLGQVPSHWEIFPFSSVARLKSVVNQTNRELLSVYLHRGVVKFSDVDEKRTNGTSEDLSRYQSVDPGDFVLNNQQAWRGSVGVSAFSGIVSPAYLVLSLSQQYLPQYANFLFRDQCMVSQYLICSKGVGTIQRNLYWPQLKRVGVPLPPPSEQGAIVRFLGWANGRLERAIRAKRKIIALLHEQKQAIIHQAVTQGLHPNAPKRDSGIPWLGEIPSHWEVMKLRFLFRYCKGSRAAEITNEYIGRNVGEFPVYSGQTEDGGVMGHLHWHEFTFDSPVVFVSTVGARAMSTRIVQGCFSLSQNCALIIPRSSAISVTFFEKVFQRLFAYEKASISLVMQPSLRFADLNRFSVPLPPHSEQVLIADVLSERLGKLDSVMERLEREIELLREYRTRLVADVVTGKLDVRAVAAGLPEEEGVLAPEEEEGADEAGEELEEVEG
jgi:type I restriction enzyme S subunit